MMRDDRNVDKPQYSRLFIVCSKQLQEEDLTPLFEEHGEIEEMRLPRDRNTGEPKGIAYIKYRKTSSAAAAIESLNMKLLKNSNKPLKVMVASNKNAEKNDTNNEYRRLFIKVSRDATEKEIMEHFSKFGKVVNVRIQKDRDTNECKGFAYVNYNTFLEAAIAYEQSDKKYKTVFAVPREDLKRSRNNYDNLDKFTSSDSVYMRESRNENEYKYRGHHVRDKADLVMPLIKTTPGNFDTIKVLCNPYVPQKCIEKLFNIIPGMIQFKFTSDSFSGNCNALIKYDSKIAASHAMEKLNNYEFPSGEKITLKPELSAISKVADNLTSIVNSFKNTCDSNSDIKQLADAIAEASSLIKAATGVDVRERDTDNFNENQCSVKLPPIQPMASANSKFAKRCFIVFKPQPLPVGILRDIFCRFGDLIDVSAIHNKTFGFAKYASVQSAENAIKTLHGATIHEVTLKVLEAEERLDKDEKMLDDDSNDIEQRNQIKRAKLDNATD